MDNMKGTFSPEVQAQISGQSTAPLAGQTAPAASAPSGSATLTTSRAASSASKSASPSTTAKDNAKSNGALSSKAGWVGIILSALVGVAAF